EPAGADAPPRGPDALTAWDDPPAVQDARTTGGGRRGPDIAGRCGNMEKEMGRRLTRPRCSQRPRAWRAAPAALLSCGLALPLAVAAQTRPWPYERPPRPLPARSVQFPPYEIDTLPNGLQVIVVRHHEQPAVSMRLLIRAGTASDPPGKLGLVHELASLLDQGTETQSASALNDTIDFIGGAMGAGAS